jgi:hypothetical protein
MPAQCKKRLIAEIIPISMGTTALALPTANALQIANLKIEVKATTDSLGQMNQTISTHNGQILHLTEGATQAGTRTRRNTSRA